MIQNIERTKDGIDSLVDRTRDAVIGVASRAERGVESAAEHVAEGAHAAGEYVRDGAKTASRGAHRRRQAAAKAIDRGYTRARGDLSRAAATATDYVTENPGKVLLLAAATGFVLGMLVRRRRPGSKCCDD
jgi:ElaB/YqjD/DUF883 family membrane-anchored ribosome-binding protein